MDSMLLSLVSACTALVASILGPFVTVAVAKRQIAASVISTNRHKWIGELRDMVAELISLISAVVIVRSRWKGPWNRGLAAIEEDSRLIEKFERIMLVQWKIRLLLNPNEGQDMELHDSIMSAFHGLQDETWDEKAMLANVEKITRLAQVILKREWQRVKAGD
jgi:hypothetical protein